MISKVSYPTDSKVSPEIWYESPPSASNESPIEATKTPRRHAWRGTLVSGIIFTGAILLSNIALLVWAKYRDKSSIPITSQFNKFKDGARYTVYQPESCDDMKRASIYAHIGINVVSTLLLAASMTAIQCLCAPTRRDLDACHPKLQWFHVGVLGFRNWYCVSTSRKLLWLAVALAFLPFHIFYNSIIFAGQTSTEFDVGYVAENFLDGDAWNFTSISPSDPRYVKDGYRARSEQVINRPFLFNNDPRTEQAHRELLMMLQSDQDQLVRFEKEQCIGTYNRGVMSDFRNLIIVLDTIDQNNTLLAMMTLDGAYRYHFGDWLCNAIPIDYRGECRRDVSTIASDWVVTFPSLPTPLPQPVPVKYCLAQKIPSNCSLSISIPLMIVVIVWNTVQLVCLITVCVIIRDEPLVTVGDAIASFLRRPDETSIRLRPVSYQQVKGIAWTSKSSAHVSADLLLGRRTWFRASGPGKWTITILLCITVWLFALCPLVITPPDADAISASERFRGYWTSGLSGLWPSPGNWLTRGDDTRLAKLSLAANSPQLLISFFYVFCNMMFTSMLASAECMSYEFCRKPLRVSTPEGQQYSTYWLQLPYHYSLPLLATMAVLHWLVSQSLFLVDVREFEMGGLMVDMKSGLAWSGLACFLSLIVGSMIIIALFANAFRTYKGRMPVLSTCSLAISASCNRHGENQDIIFEPLQYGKAPSGSGGVKRVVFSAQPVEPLDNGTAQAQKSKRIERIEASS